MGDALEKSTRAARLAEIERQIAAGTYDTPERLEAAVDAMLRADAEGRLFPDGERSPRKRPK